MCLYLLSYAGFFRSEEVVSIRRNHITFHEGYITIKVEKSKSDQLRQGDEVVIAQSGGSVCPVFILREYLGRLNINPRQMSPFLDSWSKPRNLTSWQAKINRIDCYSTFRDHLTKSLSGVVPDPRIYCTHSFRSGGRGGGGGLQRPPTAV